MNKIVTIIISMALAGNIVQASRQTKNDLFSAIEGGGNIIANVIELLQDGANPNQQRNDDGKRPLHIAVENANEAAVRELLQADANPNQIDREGNTPLHLAAKAKNNNYHQVIRIVQNLLFHRANPTITDHSGKSPLDYCSEEGPYKNHDLENLMIQALKDHINTQDDCGNTPLHQAIEHGNFKETCAAIHRRANVNAQNEDSVTPLHVAVSLSFLSNSVDIIRILLENGANPFLKDFNCKTPLDIATEGSEIHNMIQAKVSAIQQLLHFMLAFHPRTGADSSANSWSPIERQLLCELIFKHLMN